MMSVAGGGQDLLERRRLLFVRVPPPRRSLEVFPRIVLSAEPAELAEAAREAAAARAS